MSPLNRRTLMKALTALPVPYLLGANAGDDSRLRTKQNIRDPRERNAKWDITLYDRPGWSNHAWYHIVEDDGTILVPVQSSNMKFPYGDFIRTETDDVVLKSSDSGESWSVIRDSRYTQFPWGCYGLPAKAADGTLVSVIPADYVASIEEKAEHLRRYGLEKFYGPTTEWLYRPWPLRMAERLRKDGVYLFEGDEGSAEMAFSLVGYACRISRDGGRSWTSRQIQGLPYFSNEAGSFRNVVITRRGAWIASVFGTPNPNRDPAPNDGFGTPRLPIGSYVLRSEDQGKSWDIRPIAYDPSGEHSFDETALLELPSGRVLAMLRHWAFADPKHPDSTLFQSHSDDGGRTWSTPTSSGISGYPAHLLLLGDGRLLCTAGHRRDPWGHHAVISEDQGSSWRTDQTKVIRDDSLEGWTTYPMSSQLKGGSIFTTYGNLKRLPPEALKELKIPSSFRAGKQDTFVYAGASLYRPDFLHSLDTPQ